MRRALSLLALLVMMAPAAIAACSDDPKRPPHAVDPAVQPSSPITGGGGPDGGTRDATVPPGQDAATTCHDLPLTSIEVQETGVAGEPPAGTGGALVDGNYDLVEAQKFVGTGTPGVTGVLYKVSMRITGQLIDRYIRQSGTTDRIVRSTFAQTGASITLSSTCPIQSQEQLTYSVTGNNLTVTDVNARTSWTFTKK
jgi:hypothetical protein